MDQTKNCFPMVPLRGLAILPGSVSHFDLTRSKSIKAIETAMLDDSRVFLLAQHNADALAVSMNPGAYYRMGVVATVRQIVRLQNNMLRVLVEAERKAELISIEDKDEYICAKIGTVYEESSATLSEDREEAMIRSVLEALMEYCTANQKIGKDVIRQINGVSGIKALLSLVANNLPMEFERKQLLLEAITIEENLNIILEFLIKETNVSRIKSELQRKVQEKVDKNQKEYILREQLRVIKEELGEGAEAEADQYRKAVDELEAKDEVKEKLRKEISRLTESAGNSAESNVLRNYIETLLELPWDKASVDNNDLDNARKILDQDHYGLTEVKERILEYLAVRNMTKEGNSPIICLVGPPGTGKTSIARSIARALNKKYVRIGLGGVHDEAEIRGHRRTYIGAMPGRIVAGLKEAGVCNPLMLLDEIDKTGSDYKGDVSSALLELLDSEQNVNFSDHYVEIPVDMSEVLFLATANDMQSIPRPLLDRMEIIEVSSYTENEKLHIAKEHLIDKQRSQNGLQKRQFNINDAALEKLINGYTREAGVRSLERKIASLCRKAAAQIYENKKKSVRITDKNIEKYLGRERYRAEDVNKQDDIGIVCGLAWTSVGGVTLQIEVNTMPGKGNLKITGQIGDVMKESAQAGITYIRSVSDRYGIAADYFSENDIHVHIPEGAVPKDGPSAGISMATAMLSAITGIKVRADVAMTGEITLRGHVLPIGGLKEKMLAAKTAGIRTVIVPQKNRPDVEEIAEEIKEGLEIRPVSTMEEVLSIALVKESL